MSIILKLIVATLPFTFPVAIGSAFYYLEQWERGLLGRKPQ